MPADPDRAKREWRGETGWYEWALRELARYFFGVGILAVLLFIPLQMKLSWLPNDAPPIFAPSLVAFFALLAMVSLCVLAALVYRALWGDGGWIDRKVTRHHGTRRDTIDENPAGPNSNRP